MIYDVYLQEHDHANENKGIQTYRKHQNIKLLSDLMEIGRLKKNNGIPSVLSLSHGKGNLIEVVGETRRGERRQN